MAYTWKPGDGGYNNRRMSNEYNTSLKCNHFERIKPLECNHFEYRHFERIKPLECKPLEYRHFERIEPLECKPLEYSHFERIKPLEFKGNNINFNEFTNYCKNGDVENAKIFYDKYFKAIDDKHNVGFYKLLYTININSKNTNDIVKEVENDQKYFNTFFNYCKNGDLENAKLWYIEHQKNNTTEFDIVDLCMCINETYENSHINIIKFIIENNIGNILEFKSSFLPNVKNDVEIVNFFEYHSKKHNEK